MSATYTEMGGIVKPCKGFGLSKPARMPYVMLFGIIKMCKQIAALTFKGRV